MATTRPTDETGFNQLDTASQPARDASHFREIVAARQRIADAEEPLQQAVHAPRAVGES